MNRRQPFTLLEVVIALAILTGGLAGFLSLATQSQNRMSKARDQWKQFHLLEQAAEYYLLQKGEEIEPPPSYLFDYPGYHTECVFADSEELPDEFKVTTGQAKLRRCTISLIRESDRQTVDSIIVDRIDYDNVSQ